MTYQCTKHRYQKVSLYGVTLVRVIIAGRSRPAVITESMQQNKCLMFASLFGSSMYVCVFILVWV